MTSANRHIVRASDQDVYYDFLDPLEELGIESVSKKCSHLDAQLKQQFDIYEQVLKAEDEENAQDSHRSSNSSPNSSPPSLSTTQPGDRTIKLPATNSSKAAKSSSVVGNSSSTSTSAHNKPTITMDDKMVTNDNANQLINGSDRRQPTTGTDRRHSRALREQQVEATAAPNAPANKRTAGVNVDVASTTAAIVLDACESKPDCDELATAQMNDDNYESANESNESHKQVVTPQPTETHKLQQDNQHNNRQQLRQLALSNRPTLNQQLQSQRQNSPVKQNLARGKQQRASISSCSSSDSYASYGSGYASSSGNSTDHELKRKAIRANSNEEPASTGQVNLQIGKGAADAASANHGSAQLFERKQTVVVGIVSATTAPTAAVSVSPDDEDADGADDDQDYGGHEDSHLQQHLSELNQLTDELANRSIFGTTQTGHRRHQPMQSTSVDGNRFPSALKSTSSSNSGSIISTGSTISSGISSTTTNDAQSISTGLVKVHKQPPALAPTPTDDTSAAPGIDSLNKRLSSHNESRSTSTTPTSIVQPKSTSSYAIASHLSSTKTSSNGEMAYSSATRTVNKQYTTSSVKPSQTQQQLPSSASTTPPSAPTMAPTSASTNPSSAALGASSGKQQEQQPYYHNLFQWEQLVSKGVTRPLLINDLDFTDLRDEDDCDLLNPSSTNNSAANQSRGRNQATGELLTISIPGGQQLMQDTYDQADSADAFGAKSRANPGTPASAPPPMPPPPISPWFNTFAGSRPQSQLMSSPSPTNEMSQPQQGEFNRDQSPANSTYSTYSRNSVCVPQTSTPSRESSMHLQYNSLQPLTSLRSASSMSSLLFGNNGKYANKRKKTMKLFWKEVREDRSLLSKLTKKKTIWDEIKPIQVDTQKLEYLFESKAKDLLLSKSRHGLDGLNQRKVKITVLDAKRSNAINIGMTKLPPMRTIKSAILKMDSSIMNREGIEKILTTMMPTEEEKSRIIEAQLANPDTPLGTAEQFLLNLASISALEARLKLWAFQLDYAQIEKEVAEPLMDLKQAIEEIESSETFRIILGTLLAIGNFLNASNAKGFQIDYLEKVPEVKDTVHKHSLLHHLCLFVQEKYDPQSTTDLYSEFSAVNRASKVDYTEVAKNLKKMQQDCKASWDYLKIVAKHDGLANLMNTCGSSSVAPSSASSSSLVSNDTADITPGNHLRSSGKLNNLSKLSMITTVIGTDGAAANGSSSAPSGANSANDQQQLSSGQPTTKQLKIKVSDFLTDCAERIMVLMVIHRRVMNRFQKLLVYLGCPSHQIKQTQPQQILKIINEFALEYRTKRERVREMLMKKQQCQHHNHHLGGHNAANRWKLNRARWAGSQQCIDSSGYHQPINRRPCSTTSSCTNSSFAGCTCQDSLCSLSSSISGPPDHTRHQSIEPTGHRHANNHHGGSNNRANSPSGCSQISNYSDYLLDQSCCDSRNQSVTPVPVERILNGNHRPHSMSVSMFDLQNQQQHHNTSLPVNGNSGGGLEDSEATALRKDEQLRRLLGAGKSLDGACSDLYQMSHFSSTMAQVTRHPPVSIQSYSKQRAASIDERSAGGANLDDSTEQARQSSYYRYLHQRNSSRCSNGVDDDELGQNSDEEILQSLVRAATAKSTHVSGHHSQNGSSSGANRSTASSHSSSANKSARNKILSRFNCDRKSSK